MVYKGTITGFENPAGGEGGAPALARVAPLGCGGVVTPPLVVPGGLRGGLRVGDEVAYAAFADATGIVLARMDGGGGGDGRGCGGVMEVGYADNGEVGQKKVGSVAKKDTGPGKPGDVFRAHGRYG